MSVIGKIGLSMLPLATVAVEASHLESLSRYGILGVVLAWFMYVTDRRLRGLESSMQGVRRAMLLDIMSRDNASPVAKRLCREELRRVDPHLAREMADQ